MIVEVVQQISSLEKNTKQNEKTQTTIQYN